MDLGEIYDGVLRGDEASVGRLVQEAVARGVEPEQIVTGQLIPAMEEVGARFEREEFFVPEMLLAARAMQSGLTVLKPLLRGRETGPAHRVVIGTVQSDIHDLGKNLVSIMLGGAGFEVTDLGADVSPERFVEAVRDQRPHIVGMSSLMTTTMVSMKRIVDALTEADLRQDVKVIVGGAPLTQQYCDEIGADGYAPDAWSAVKMAKELAGPWM
ncbi:MAG TPA: corrinoid protein [Anaerolineae bacterium]|nr:corrinoid protein [Anaerolineae bacterium]